MNGARSALYPKPMLELGSREMNLRHADWPPATSVVKAARNGDRSAIEAICRGLQPRLRAFLRYQRFDPHTIDDMVADATETVITQLVTLRQPRAFEAWFWVIARNGVATQLRRQQRVAHELPAAHPVPPDELAISRGEHDAVRVALARLTKLDQTILWLREVEGQSYSNIATILEVKAGSARVRCHRARRRLEVAYEAIIEDRDCEERALLPPPIWQAATAER